MGLRNNGYVFIISIGFITLIWNMKQVPERPGLSSIHTAEIEELRLGLRRLNNTFLQKAAGNPNVHEIENLRAEIARLKNVNLDPSKYWLDIGVDLSLGGCNGDADWNQRVADLCTALSSTRADNADIQLDIAHKAILDIQAEIYSAGTANAAASPSIPSEDDQMRQAKFAALHYAFYKLTCLFPRDVPGETSLAHHVETDKVDISASLSGAYCSNPDETRVYNFGPGLAGLVYDLFLKEADSVVEFGAGDGRYSISWLAQSEVARASGGKGPVVWPLEGAVGVEVLTKGLVHHADLTIPHLLSPSLPLFDWVVSFEVAEHVPVQFERILVENFVRHARKGVVISWSTSSSHWHVNARPNEYVKQLFKEYGFSAVEDDIKKLRSNTGIRSACEQGGGCSATKLHWLAGTALVFKRDAPFTLPDDEESYNKVWLNNLGNRDLRGEKMDYICSATWDGKENFVEYLKQQPWAGDKLKWPCHNVINRKGQKAVGKTLRVAEWAGIP